MNENTTLVPAGANTRQLVAEPQNSLQKIAARNVKIIHEDSQLLPIEQSMLPRHVARAASLSADDTAILDKYGARLLNLAFFEEGKKFRQGFKTAFLPRFAAVDPFSTRGALLSIQKDKAIFSNLISTPNKGYWVRRARQALWLPHLIVSTILACAAWPMMSFIGATPQMGLATAIVAPLWCAWQVIINRISLSAPDWWDAQSVEVPVSFKSGTIPQASRDLILAIKPLGTVMLLFEATNETYQLGQTSITPNPKPVNRDPLIVLSRNGHFFLMGSFDLTPAEYRAVKSFT